MENSETMLYSPLFKLLGEPSFEQFWAVNVGSTEKVIVRSFDWWTQIEKAIRAGNWYITFLITSYSQCWMLHSIKRDEDINF